jgi:hypothetical protein
MDTPQETYQNNMQQAHSQSQSHQQHNTHYHHLGSNSAPANIAFQTNSVPLSPGDLDFDISPLTSPWLGAHQHSSHPRQTNKRTASPSGDEGSIQPRKRQSPAIRPSNPAQNMKKNTRASKSTSSTPLLQSTRSRRNSTAVQLTPVTPASIMNLERLGLNSGLTPITQGSMGPTQDSKGKSTTKPKTVGDQIGTRKPTRKALPSPSLKAILPGEKHRCRMAGTDIDM